MTYRTEPTRWTQSPEDAPELLQSALVSATREGPSDLQMRALSLKLAALGAGTAIAAGAASAHASATGAGLAGAAGSSLAGAAATSGGLGVLAKVAMSLALVGAAATGPCTSRNRTVLARECRRAPAGATAVCSWSGRAHERSEGAHSAAPQRSERPLSRPIRSTKREAPRDEARPVARELARTVRRSCRAGERRRGCHGSEWRPLAGPARARAPRVLSGREQSGRAVPRARRHPQREKPRSVRWGGRAAPRARSTSYAVRVRRSQGSPRRRTGLPRQHRSCVTVRRVRAGARCAGHRGAAARRKPDARPRARRGLRQALPELAARPSLRRDDEARLSAGRSEQCLGSARLCATQSFPSRCPRRHGRSTLGKTMSARLRILACAALPLVGCVETVQLGSECLDPASPATFATGRRP